MSDNNPLPKCPDTPNCERVSISFNQSKATLITAVEKTLKDMGAHSFNTEPDSGKFEAVFKIPVFGWKDDVAILLKKVDDHKTDVFIRSASRVGYSDLGVNNRRVRRLIKHITKQLSDS